MRNSCFSVIMLAVLICMAPSLAKNYYVSPSGDDTHDGSISSPWRHIAFATCGGAYGCPCSTSNSNKLKAGDTLLVNAGTYHESNINISNSGTAQNPIVIKAQPGTMPILIGDTTFSNGNPMFNLGVRNPVKHIVFDSLSIQLCRVAGKRLGENYAVGHITIKNCSITKIVRADNSGAVFLNYADTGCIISNCCLSPNNLPNNQNSMEAIGVIQFAGSNDAVISGCEIGNCQRAYYVKHGVPGASLGPVIKDCYIHDVSDMGIVSTTDKMVIQNNLLVNTGIGIHTDISASCNVQGGYYNKIIHNTIYNGGIELGSAGECNGARNTAIKDNIITGTNSGQRLTIWPYKTKPDSIGDRTISDSNCLWANNSNFASWYNTTCSKLADFTNTSKLDSHSVFGNPTFTNTSGAMNSIKDFVLLPGYGYKAAADGTDMGANIDSVGVRGNLTTVINKSEKTNRKVCPQSAASSHCSFVLADRRSSFVSGERIFDIRGRRLWRDQVRQDGIVISVTH